MPPDHPDPLAEELRDGCQTISGLHSPHRRLAATLQFIADLVADAGPLPAGPLLLWRCADHSVRHARIGPELTVGRSPGEPGLALGHDKLLSRRHFIIRATGGECVLEDLNSHNGTALKEPENRIQTHSLRDGDLILAGRQVLLFLRSGDDGETPTNPEAGEGP